ncbi:MAG: hypothetical protein U0Q10_01830 [Dermatophilaceae bacterium]
MSSHPTVSTGTPSPAALVARTRAGRARAVAVTAVYGLLSLLALALAAPGPVGTLTGKDPTSAWHVTGFLVGAFKVLTLGPALVVAATRGRSVAAVRLLAVGQVAWCLAGVLSPQPGDGRLAAIPAAAFSLVLWVGPWFLLSPARRRLWADPWPTRRALLLIAAVALPAVGIWLGHQAALPSHGPVGSGDYRELRYDVTGAAAALGVSLLTAATLGALWWDRTVATVLAVVGILSAVYPDGYGSAGRPGGVALVLAAAALAWTGRSAGSTAGAG